MDVKISDIGLALMTMDMELDRLDLECEQLETKLEHNRSKAACIRKAMIRLHELGLYEIGDV